MSGYGCFAGYYDVLTQNIDYRARAAYFADLIQAHAGQSSGKVMLDLACGTGSLTLELAALGYDMIGADLSPDMLSMASAKATDADILWICQPMHRLNLYAPVDFIVCALDSINHITEPAQLLRTFERVSRFLKPGGLFLFDVNSEYKHKYVLADNTFVYEAEQVYCVWQNAFEQEKSLTHISLDFFALGEQGQYTRSSEQFCERMYPQREMEAALANAGLDIASVYEGDTKNPVSETTQRIVYVTQKPPV